MRYFIAMFVINRGSACCRSTWSTRQKRQKGKERRRRGTRNSGKNEKLPSEL